jgi:hypothetical protein
MVVRLALHFHLATAYVGSRRSRPCIRTTMPELIRLTIASPTDSVNSRSDLVVIKIVGLPLSKR